MAIVALCRYGSHEAKIFTVHHTPFPHRPIYYHTKINVWHWKALLPLPHCSFWWQSKSKDMCLNTWRKILRDGNNQIFYFGLKSSEKKINVSHSDFSGSLNLDNHIFLHSGLIFGKQLLPLANDFSDSLNLHNRFSITFRQFLIYKYEPTVV